MRWLLFSSSALAWTITGTKAALRAQGDLGDLEYTDFGSPLSVDGQQSIEVRFEFSADSEADTELKQAFATIEDAEGRYQSVAAKIRKNTARVVVPSAKLSGGRSELRVHVASESGTASSDALVVESSATPEVAARSPWERTNALSFKPLPVIEHQFRPPPRHVSAVVAAVFAAAVWALFAGLLAVWQSEVGLSIGAVPFVGSLAAIEGVFLGYYLSWSIFTTLLWTAVGGAAAVVLGQRALVASLKAEPTVAAVKEKVPAAEGPKDAEPVKAKKTKKTK